MQDQNSPLIDELNLSTRSYNCLRRSGLHTVAQVAVLSDEELLAIHQLGQKALADIREKLAAYLAEHPLPDEAEERPPKPATQAAESLLPQVPSPPADPTPLGVLGLSARPYNALMGDGITTIGQLAAMSREQIREVRNVGEKSLAEIEEKLTAYLSEHPLPDEAEKGPSEPEAQAVEPLLSQPLSPPPDPTPLGVLGLSARPYNALKRAGITTIGQLAAISRKQIWEVRNVGEKALAEIESKLEAYLADPSRFKAPAVAKESPPLPLAPPPDSEMPDTSADEQTLPVQVEKWLSVLTDRQRQVIRWRYGLDGSEPETLEEVGQRLGITRERVRQIQSKSLKRLRRPRCRQWVRPSTTLLHQTFIETGGLCTEERLGQVIAEATDTTGIDAQGIARLLLETHGAFKQVKGIKKERVWGLSDAPLKLVPDIHQQMDRILRNEHAPLPVGEVLARFKVTRFCRNHHSQLEDTFVVACLQVHPDIEINGEGLCALTKWSGKRLHEIIHALRELGEPSHYSKIAETINAGLPPERHIAGRTVQIRLTQHPEMFIWVGLRGTYGLKEWGLEQVLSYEDALAQILRQAGHPLTFQQILAELPKFRPYYEESSIVLTLGTNERFRSFLGNTYGLAEWQEDEVATKDYRLKRLFDDVEVASSPKLRPEITKTLNGVDSFIAKARERLSDEV